MSQQPTETRKIDERTLTIATLVTKQHGLAGLIAALSQRLTGINPSIDVQVYATLPDMRLESEAIGMRLMHIEAGGPFHPPTTEQAQAVHKAVEEAQTLIEEKAETLRLIAVTHVLLRTYGAASSQA